LYKGDRNKATKKVVCVAESERLRLEYLKRARERRTNFDDFEGLREFLMIALQEMREEKAEKEKIQAKCRP